MGPLLADTGSAGLLKQVLGRGRFLSFFNMWPFRAAFPGRDDWTILLWEAHITQNMCNSSDDDCFLESFLESGHLVVSPEVTLQLSLIPTVNPGTLSELSEEPYEKCLPLWFAYQKTNH